MNAEEGLTILWVIMLIAVLLSFCLGLIIGYFLGKKDRQKI
jgi:uncharacterized protein YneF (UPF0154 family)